MWICKVCFEKEDMLQLQAQIPSNASNPNLLSFFRRKDLTLELRGYLHGRKEQQREKEIRANEHLQRRKVMHARANDLMISFSKCLFIGAGIHFYASGRVCRNMQVQMMRRGRSTVLQFVFLRSEVQILYDLKNSLSV